MRARVYAFMYESVMHGSMFFFCLTEGMLDIPLPSFRFFFFFFPIFFLLSTPKYTTGIITQKDADQNRKTKTYNRRTWGSWEVLSWSTWENCRKAKRWLDRSHLHKPMSCLRRFRRRRWQERYRSNWIIQAMHHIVLIGPANSRQCIKRQSSP